MIGVFMLMSMTGSVIASTSLYSQPLTRQAGLHEGHSGGHHGATGHARHDHDKAMVSQKARRACLAFCFQALGEHYLAAASSDIPLPKFITVNPVLINPPSLTSQIQTSFPGDGGRGPPGYLPSFAHPGLQGLLILNARLRN